MYCNNCQHSNAPNSARCKQCNAPLVGSIVKPPIKHDGQGIGVCYNCGHSNKAGVLKCAECNVPLNGSMIENLPKPPVRPRKITPAPEVPSPEIRRQDQTLSCQHCGYLNIQSAKQCARCSQSLTTAIPARAVSPVPMVKPATPKTAKTSLASTINPWDKPEPIPNGFELKPLHRPQESNLSFEGDLIQVNRANLDPENRSITSKVQAELYVKDGQWYLDNKSEHKTTYIRVQEAIPIKPGDVLLLGDQLFEFNLKT